MFDLETAVIAVYVAVDEFLPSVPPRCRKRGQQPTLTPSELLTLAIISQSAQFASERAFARWLHGRGRSLFPRVPDRRQLNRAFLATQPVLVAFGRWQARQLGAHGALYEVLDSTAVPLRNPKRRGGSHLAEVIELGFSSRLGWFQGVRLLAAATPEGIITGYALGDARSNDRVLAEAFVASRAEERPLLPEVGRASSGVYLADANFAGEDCIPRWAALADAHVYAPPRQTSKQAWPAGIREALRSARQIIETVFERLHGPFRLETDRPKSLAGLHFRVAAKVALHNWLIAWNRVSGRPDLAIAGVIDW